MNEIPWIDRGRLGVFVGENLVHTSQSLSEVLEHWSLGGFSDDAVFLQGIDDTALECQGCNWWVPADGAYDNDDGNPLCADCAA